MHNLGTVMRFEIVRSLKKKSFWALALGFPLLFAAIFGIAFASNKSTEDAVANLNKQQFSFEITDDSGVVKPELITASGAVQIDSKEAGRAHAESGSVDAYIYYPRDLATNKIEIYAKDVGIFDNAKYSAVAQALLTSSVQGGVPADVLAIIQGKVESEIKTYRDGKEFDSFKQMIAPGIFLVLFYLLIAFFGGQMLTSTTEEKENRVIEMILTTIEARTLIVGKIISMIILAFIQGTIIVLPPIIGYLLLHDQLALPAIDLNNIPLDWARIAVSAAIFATSFLLFTGLLVAIGASVPTAKEANGFMGMVMILLFGPLYAASLFVSAPGSPFVIALSLFPFTAPIPLLLRNAVGNLQAWEIAAALAILALSAIIIMGIAVRIFRYGALEYSRKLSIREIFLGK